MENKCLESANLTGKDDICALDIYQIRLSFVRGIPSFQFQVSMFEPIDRLPGLPHLRSHSHKTVEEFFSESNGSKLLLIPLLINDQKTISDLSFCCPAYHQLRLPSKPTHFLNFLCPKLVTSKTRERRDKPQYQQSQLKILDRYPLSRWSSLAPDSSPYW
jgi:hypothetical protein